MTTSNINNGQFGDTTLTKVFVGGLAWETPKDTMREHFEKFGDILEAVIISDKFTGRSKGYGFVTFKDAEAAKKACEDATPVINGRRANCNLASLGARRPRASSTTPPQQWSSQNYKIATDVVATDGATNIGPRSTSNGPTNQVPWYYPVGTPASPFHHQHHQAVPYYGYSPTYVTTDMSYNHKLSYNGGSYMNGHFSSQMYHHGPPPMVGANTLMPMYPLYHFHQPQTIGLPAHMYSPTTAGPITTVPALMSKPVSITPPNSGTVVSCGALRVVGKST